MSHMQKSFNNNSFTEAGKSIFGSKRSNQEMVMKSTSARYQRMVLKEERKRQKRAMAGGEYEPNTIVDVSDFDVSSESSHDDGEEGRHDLPKSTFE